MDIKLVKQLQEMSLYEEGSDINVESNRLNPEDALFKKYPNLEKGGVIHQAHMPKNVILVWWFNPSTAEFVRSKDSYHLHMYDYRDKINIAEEHQWVRGRVFRNGDKVVVVIYDLKSMSEYARWDLLSKISSDIKPLMVSYIIDKDERDISNLFEGTCYKLTPSKTGYWKVVEGVLVEAGEKGIEMDIKLVKQLMEDNNLFKPASSDEQESRKESEDSVLRAKLASFKAGTKVKVKDDANIDPYRRDNKGLNGVVAGYEPDHLFVHYPIKVLFRDRVQEDAYTVDWFAPEELEKI